MSNDMLDIAVEQLRAMSDSERLQVLARIGAVPRPLTGGVVKMTLRLKPGRNSATDPPIRQRPKERMQFIKRRAG